MSDEKFDREALVEQMRAAYDRAAPSGRAAWLAALAVAEEAIRADEREACAQIAETTFTHLSNMSRAAGNEIAAAIRAREAQS